MVPAGWWIDERLPAAGGDLTGLAGVVYREAQPLRFNSRCIVESVTRPASMLPNPKRCSSAILRCLHASQMLANAFASASTAFALVSATALHDPADGAPPIQSRAWIAELLAERDDGHLGVDTRFVRARRTWVESPPFRHTRSSI